MYYNQQPARSSCSYKTTANTMVFKATAVIGNIQAPSPAISFYPNPALTTLTVRAPDNESFALCDLLGRAVLSGRLPANKQLNVNMLPAGNYMLRIDGQSLPLTKK